jgi:ATP-dependent DNA helicase RecQ
MAARNSMSAVYKLLRERFGHTAFQPGQEELVARLMAGGDVAAEFAAGSGVRLCYQLVAWLGDQPTLVLSPQRQSLVEDVQRLQAKGLAAASFEGGLGPGAAEAVAAALQSGQLRLLYATGDDLRHRALRVVVERIQWGLVVLEQAQQACPGSPRYRPGWQWVLRQVRRLSARSKLYLAETGSPGALAELAADLPGAILVRGPWWRSNVALQAGLVDRHELAEAVVRRLAARPAGASLICCTGAECAVALASAIRAFGRPVQAVHGGMKPPARRAVHEWFLSGEQPVLVAATPIASLPHRADLRAVYLCRLPADVHELLAAASHAGRDGLPARCELLIGRHDATVLENQWRAAVPDALVLRALLEELFSGPRQKLFNKYQAAHRYDLSVAAIEDVLGCLALEGSLAEGNTAPGEMRFKCREPLPRIVRRFEGERAEFLKRVFGAARRARTWHYLDLRAAETRLAESFERAMNALEYLKRRGLVELHAAGAQTHLECLGVVADVAQAARQLRERLLVMRDQRLRAVRELRGILAHAGCWLERLGSYLGYVAQGECGCCTWCTGGQVLADQAGEAAIPENLWEQWRAAQAQHAQALTQPATAARFLCGISTPRLARQRLTRHPLFGACRHVPVAEVYRQVQKRGMQPLAAG